MIKVARIEDNIREKGKRDGKFLAGTSPSIMHIVYHRLAVL